MEKQEILVALTATDRGRLERAGEDLANHGEEERFLPRTVAIPA